MFADEARQSEKTRYLSRLPKEPAKP